MSVQSRMMLSTNPSSKLTTSRCMVAIVMTKMNASWKKGSIATLYRSFKSIIVFFKAFKLLIKPLSDLLCKRDKFVSTSSDSCIFVIQYFAYLLHFFTVTALILHSEIVPTSFFSSRVAT